MNQEEIADIVNSISRIITLLLGRHGYAPSNVPELLRRLKAPRKDRANPNRNAR